MSAGRTYEGAGVATQLSEKGMERRSNTLMERLKTFVERLKT
jgi:hypothetical protein